MTPLERFESKIHYVPIAGCWLYVDSSASKFGHPHCWDSGIRYSAHRYAYQKYVGPIGGMHVLHRCDTPSCVNPHHLFLGTHDDNMKDKAKKGRASRMPNESHPMHKLTNLEVLAIRRRGDAGGNHRDIAMEFKVSQPCVSMIISRKRRGSLPEE